MVWAWGYSLQLVNNTGRLFRGGKAMISTEVKSTFKRLHSGDSSIATSHCPKAGRTGSREPGRLHGTRNQDSPKK